MIKDLIKLANDLDSKGFEKEADRTDTIVKKAMGDLVDLGDYRDRQDVPDSNAPRLTEEQRLGLQGVLSELDLAEDGSIELVVLGDGETYSSLGDSYIVTVTDDEMEKMMSGEKMHRIINENRWVPVEEVLDRDKLLDIK